MSKFLKLMWKLERENPTTNKFTKKTLVVYFLDQVFVNIWTSSLHKLKNRDERLLKRMKNGNISSGELILAVNHDNKDIRKLVMQYIKSPKDIDWRI